MCIMVFKDMKAKTWISIWVIVVSLVMIVNLGLVLYVDPFFHYHKPRTEEFFYSLDNQRSQNDGIVMYFDYNAVITGTSMAENFKSSDMDRIFEVHSIKIPFSGATYKEINDCLNKALNCKKVKTVIRSLDINSFLNSWSQMRTDLGVPPSYLYDDNVFNDTEYLINRDTVFGRVYPMMVEKLNNAVSPGITSFDEYSRWQERCTFGIESVYKSGEVLEGRAKKPQKLSEKQKAVIKRNIEVNIVKTAEEHPETDFYYFFTPYSVIYWKNKIILGELQEYNEAERFITELLLSHNNIHLFGFSNRTDIISNLNNYKDPMHYGDWVNSLILKWMHDGKYQLTWDNYDTYLDDEYTYFLGYDYDSIDDQEDYEADLYAEALLNKELTGASPVNIVNDSDVMEGHKRLEFDLAGGYKYLCFYGKGFAGENTPKVYVSDMDGDIIEEMIVDEGKLDNKKHQFVIDLSDHSGIVDISFEGGDVSMEAGSDGDYRFYDVWMY